MDKGYAVAKLKMGVIGVTVEIMRNEKLPADITVFGKTEAAAIAPEIFAGKDVAEKDVPAVEAETVEEGQ